MMDDSDTFRQASGVAGVTFDEPVPASNSKKKTRRGGDPSNQKRRCVSTACIACRKRKSKCDGVLPSCAACASVYGTECVYDPNSDHRRKGVYREKIDSMKARNSTLQILIEAILNAAEDDVPEIVRKIRTCDSLDNVAETILKQDNGEAHGEDEEQSVTNYSTEQTVGGERDLAGKMGELRLDNGAVRFIGGTSHLIYLEAPSSFDQDTENSVMAPDANPITCWSSVDKDPDVIIHLLNMYWNWHYPYFTALSRSLFYRDFLKGRQNLPRNQTAYCSSLLVNAMLALGCHFTNVTRAYATPGDSSTKGDHFFAECKRLIVENNEYEKPRLTTVQALALMSVREAGCGRESKGWVYSGMSFRMAQDLGLNLDIGGINTDSEHLNEQEVDARRVTFWGCFLFDKCWSNYLGRLPQLPNKSHSVPKYDVFPNEDAEDWCPYTDTGYDETTKQPSRTRAVGLQLARLCEISSDLLLFFYHPNHIGRSSGKSVELKKLSELHRRLEDWRKELPRELEPKEGQLPNVILMHMFFHLQYIHLFRPFLKYAPNASPLPNHVSPRRICTANAGAVSKLMRLYKKLYNLRQICNIAVYMLHSACTIHLLNLPEKTAKRDIIHGIKHLEEIAEDWLAGRRTLSIISVLARKWNCELPEEAFHVLQRTDARWGHFNTSDIPSPHSHITINSTPPGFGSPPPPMKQEYHSPMSTGFVATPGSTAQSPQVTSELLDNMAPSPQAFQPSPSAMNNHAIMGQSIPLNLDGLGTTGQDWQPTPAMQTTMPGYNPAYAAASASVAPQSRTTSGTAGPPRSVYAVDGQEWCIKDSVSWQTGFDAWNAANKNSSTNAGPSVTATSSSMSNAPASSSAAHAANGPPSASNMFMFGNASRQPTGSPESQRSPPPPGATGGGDFPFDYFNDMPGNLGAWDLSGLE